MWTESIVPLLPYVYNQPFDDLLLVMVKVVRLHIIAQIMEGPAL
jgi:hypothetical protein